jgi:prevent-host-death family protein
MTKTISASKLRTYLKQVLLDVGYYQGEYLVERFGEPIAAIIPIEDFELLKAIKQQQPSDSSSETESDF